MDQLKQSGIFYFSSQGLGLPGAFPEDCKRSIKSRFEPQFTFIFLGLLLVIGGTVGILSSMEFKTEVSEQDIAKLQARYAKLVLNKEMPKPKEDETKKAAEAKALAEAAAKAAAEAAALAKAEMDAKVKEEAVKEEKKATETVQEKSARKAASSEQRAVKREAMKKQIENVGLFAELTAVGTGGGGGKGGGKGGVRDLIGNIDASSSLSGMSLSNSSFVSKRADAYEGGGPGGSLRERRGERAEGGSIGTSEMTSAAAGTLKSEGSVEMSSVENISGDGANDASRDMKSLQMVLQRFQPRLKKVYEDFLKRNPELAGKFVVKFTIEADGSVSNITVVASDLNDKELERNLIRYIERIKFAPASGKITIEWPLIFSAG